MHKTSAQIQLSQVTDKRPIHYLGSKLRILEFINKTIDDLDPSLGTVCDLFSGSGTVSNFLAQSRTVISVDIQEYSNVICSALLRPKTIDINIDGLISDIQNSSNYILLTNIFSELLKYEDTAIMQASTGNIEDLYEIIENGSFYVYEHKQSKKINSDLETVLEKTQTKIIKNNLYQRPQIMTTRYFGGLYFSYRQAIYIDAIIEEISKYNNNLRNILMAALLSTVSDIVNTVGKQFAQPLKVRSSSGKLKKSLITKVLKDRTMSVFDSFKEWLNWYLSNKVGKYPHKVMKMDYYEALKNLKNSNINVVYADPPYTRYHYSRYYHVLETICLRDNPKVSTTFLNGEGGISRGIYRSDRHQSPFSIKSKAGGAFDKLFSGVAELDVPLILSYSPFSDKRSATPRMQTIEQLVEKANSFYKSVDVVSVGQFSHSKLNSTDKNFAIDNEAELLIICKEPI